MAHYTLRIDENLLRRQRLAVEQSMNDSPHPLRTELLSGALELLDEIAAQAHCAREQLISSDNRKRGVK